MSLLEKASLIVTPNAYKESILYSVVPNTTLGDMTVVRATTATRVNSEGLIESVGVNVPRIDYTNGSCPSLLVEPQRTNLLTYSEQFDNADWNKINCTINVNSTNAPNGTLTADKLIASAVNSNHIIYQIPNFINYNPYCFSYYAKASEYSKTALRIGGPGYSIVVRAEIDLLNGNIIYQQGFTSLNVELISNGWYLIKGCFVSATGLVPNIIPLSNDYITVSENYTYLGNGTSGIYVWGAQLEQGSYATSYIPTVASTVTRNADVISKTGISSLIGQTEGTFFADVVLNNNSTFYTILNTANSTSNAITIHIESNVFLAYVFANGVQKSYISGGTVVPNSRYKIAFSYKSGNSALYINGVSIGTSTDVFSFSNTLGQIKIADNVEYFSIQNAIKINSSQIYETRLLNTELQSLTTL